MKIKLSALIAAFLIIVLFRLPDSYAEEFKIYSPDKKNEIKIVIDKDILFSVNNNGNPLINPSKLSLELENGNILGKEPEVINQSTRSVDGDDFVYKKIKISQDKNFNIKMAPAGGWAAIIYKN